jgi:cytoskeletal protein CcmA (bactofilin family)
MAIWKDQTAPKKDSFAITEPVPTREPEPAFDAVPARVEPPRRPATRVPGAESVIASDITIEGKIEGAGHVRLAGRFKGDVIIQGDLTVEAGAKLTGSIRANSVVIAGEIEGNIDGAARVDLQESGVVNGDVKVGTMTVAAGSRMRGRAEFGWGEEQPTRPTLT